MALKKLCVTFYKNLGQNRFYTKKFESSLLRSLNFETCSRNKIHTSSYLFTEENQKNKSSKETGKSHSTLKQTSQLAKVFAEYGSTAVIFHTSISLTSLGICYTAVSSGLDVVGLLKQFNLIKEVTTEATITGQATTFVISYAVHKVFMPLRIFCTVTCTPLLVKKLRQIGVLQNPLKVEKEN